MKTRKIVITILAIIAIAAACYGIFALQKTLGEQPSRQDQEIRS